jgi:23S rRNA pseudouridine2605 synthase
MAKKNPDMPTTPTTIFDRWKPARAMGAARALMKAGYGTRKQTGDMVSSGRVVVGDEVIRDPNQMLEAGSNIYLDGEPLARLRHSYYAFNKPVRIVCSVVDGPGKRLVSDFYPRDIPGLQCVGRLDAKTSGLLLISNDRPWSNLVAGSKALEQEFRVQVEGELTDLEIGVMTAGVHLPKLGLFRPLSVKVVEVLNGRTVINMVVKEGKIRQVRRMLGTLRHKAVMVRRTRIGSIRLGDLPAGGVRHLTPGEVHTIFEMGKAPAVSAGEKGK